MPTFTVPSRRVDRNEALAVVEAFFKAVDTPTLPRGGGGIFSPIPPRNSDPSVERDVP